MNDPYATGVLFPEQHDRLVANIAGYARDAGIQPQWVWTRMADACGPDEMYYARKFKFHRAGGVIHGLCYVRESDEADPSTRMAAMAGALVRNFIRARVMTLGTVLDTLASGEDVEATCLLIPNFFVPRVEGGTIATWQVNTLLDLLIHRGQLGLQTVIYAASLDLMRKEYGAAFGTIVKSHYQVVGI